MKWICWSCGRENPFRPLKAVQDKCPKCGDELRTGRAPLATTTNIAGFLLMIGGVFWGMDHLVPAPLNLPVFTVLAVLFAVAVGAGMVAAGLHLYNRAAEARREEANR